MHAGATASSFWNQTFYHQAIIPLVIVTVLLAWKSRPSAAEEIPKGFRKFQGTFLVVWVFCVAADWLQGPYVYALYEAYGFPRETIAQLFVVGFGSSLIFSGIVGAFVDKFGRKKATLAYCVLYILSCLTKHFNDYWVLFLGRVTGGIATSLLFSSFECWMVSEHLKRNNFSTGLLGYMFGIMFTVMYLVAVACGFIGEWSVNTFTFSPIAEGSLVYTGGYLMAFDVAIVCLFIGMGLIVPLWEENYGDEAASGSSLDFASAFKLFKEDKKTLLLCAVVACFEGAMYAFVFNWTPALESSEIPPPYGIIFSLFMMSAMCGASVAVVLGEQVKPWMRLSSACLLGAGGLTVAATQAGVDNATQLKMVFTGFILFEFCVGLYYPSVGFVKSEVVPENVRATVYNIFRVPLNMIVVGLLLTNISVVQSYVFCAILIMLAFGAATAIGGLTSSKAEIDPESLKNIKQP